MNCQDFITEFEERRDLNASARFHINDCAGCQKISHTQTRIWESIDNFAKINAPGDFEFGVKARIANGAPNNLRPQFIPVLRYVLPLSVVVLIAGWLAFNTAFFFGSDNAPQLAQTIVSSPEIKTNIPINNFQAPVVAPVENTNNAPVYPSEAFVVKTSNQNVKPSNIKQQTQETQFAFKSSRKSTNDFTKTDIKLNDDNNGGGSSDKAGTLPKVLTPEGFDVTTPIENSSKVNDLAPIKVGNVWSLLGLEITSENGRQVIKSVRQNSVAARSNIMIGDVIEAVDGVKFSGAPMSSGKIEVKTLTVLRGNEKVEISLKN